MPADARGCGPRRAGLVVVGCVFEGHGTIRLSTWGREAKWVKKIWSEVFCAEKGQQEQVMALVDAFQETRQPFAETIWGYLQAWTCFNILTARRGRGGTSMRRFSSSTKHRSRAKAYMANSPKLLTQGIMHQANTGTWLVRGGRVTFGVDDRNALNSRAIQAPWCVWPWGQCQTASGAWTLRRAGQRVACGNRPAGLGAHRAGGDFQAEVHAFDIRLKGSTFTTDSATFQSDMFGTRCRGRPLQGSGRKTAQKAHLSAL